MPNRCCVPNYDFEYAYKDRHEVQIAIFCTKDINANKVVAFNSEKELNEKIMLNE